MANDTPADDDDAGSDLGRRRQQLNGAPGVFKRMNHCPWFGSTRCQLYVGYFISRWGDRMWMFALSIVLGSIGSHNLQLTAVNGFVNSIAVLLFATSVGHWIDKTPRLKAATSVLIINNFSVALSAGLLVAILLAPHVAYLRDLDYSPEHATIVTRSLVAGSILLCAFSTLASCGTKICISKDWVVVISNGDKELLADINAWMLRLDLTSMILSPLLAGQIMTSFGQSSGCVYIALWNAFSFIIEYFVLRSIYYSCPGLAVKHVKPAKINGVSEEENADCQQCHLPVCSCVYSEDVKDFLAAKSAKRTSSSIVNKNANGFARQRRLSSSVSGITKPFRKFFAGWRSYYRQQPTYFAGVGLALLYLTVLGLDGITTVYIYSQGIRENVVALSRGAGAIVGILGSVAYPRLRLKCGVVKTGLYALLAQISCNLLAVVSIWLPGSPFDPAGYFGGGGGYQHDGLLNSSTFENKSALHETSNLTSSRTGFEERSNASILTFLVGIVLARFGLWMADLAITQIMQENIADHERGVINGVQHSMNQCLNMIKDILVILLPDPRTFGLLILVSFCSVCSGFVSFVIYAKKSVKLEKQIKAVELDNGGSCTRTEEKIAFLPTEIESDKVTSGEESLSNGKTVIGVV